jgi:ABC-2 type transport system permease protein
MATLLFISALIAVGYAIQSASRQRAEESAARAEPILATAVSRRQFAGSHLAVAIGGSLVLLLMYGLGAGITRAISTDDAAQLPRLIGASVAYAPALWVFVGLVAVLFGLAPRAIGVAWVVFGALAFIGFLGPLLQLLDWVYNLSPLEHIPRMPVAGFSLAPIVALTGIAATLVGAGLAGFQRRDIGT